MDPATKEPDVSRPRRSKTTVLKLLLGVSLVLNVGLIIHLAFLRGLAEGGGQYAASPDGKHIAHAQSRRALIGSKDVYYVFSIETSTGQLLKLVRIDAKETKDSMYFRRLPEIIRWSADSTEATFTIPGLQLKMDRDLHPDSALGS